MKHCMNPLLSFLVFSSDSGHGCTYEHDGTDQHEYVSRNFEHALDLSFFSLDFLFAFALHDVEPKTFCLTVFVHCVFPVIYSTWRVATRRDIDFLV